jgi:small subunit ribosomal protein S19
LKGYSGCRVRADNGNFVSHINLNFFIMTRSSYKIPYTARFLQQTLFADLGDQVPAAPLPPKVSATQKEKKVAKVPMLLYQRSSTIVPEMIGSSVKIHTGHKWVKLLINEHLIGYKFGEFAPTKKRALYKKRKKR